MSAFPVIISAPSGGGKTSIARRILETRSDVGYSVSVTTRPPRQGEVDGRDYHFWGEADFQRGVSDGEFAEWAPVHGNLYGTLRREIESLLASGRHAIMDIDVQGARQLVNNLSGVVSIFVLPPSARALIDRLGGRRSENEASFRLRLGNAMSELLGIGRYDYVVVNEDLNMAAVAIGAIIDAESLRRERVDGLEFRINELVSGLQRELGPSGSGNHIKGNQ